ncbi:MAG TPA: pilus assembly protein [Janthinobacterium sp.]|nr:pilus assembly protein [Janthinobacterium sp.]
MPALAGLLAACAPTTPRLDAAFGDTVRVALASQIMHPGASANTDPVVGIDGASALKGLQGYQKSFAEPAVQSNTFMIGVNGGK